MLSTSVPRRPSERPRQCLPPRPPPPRPPPPQTLLYRSSFGSQRLMRIFVDGSFGIGKSCTLGALSGDKVGSPVFVTTEPMRYWREFFVDLIATIGLLAKLRMEKQNDPECLTLVSEAHASLQMKFADPYLLLHERLSDLYGPQNVILGDPDYVLCFDRHALASTACFPAARFLNGDCDADSFLSLLIKTPKEPPGCNLMVADLDDEREHLRRLSSRCRPGESVNTGLLRALRLVYKMLIATIDYANRMPEGGEGITAISREQWDEIPWLTDARRELLLSDGYCRSPAVRSDNPRLKDTMLALLKTEALCDSDGNLRRVHSWVWEAFLEKVKGIHVTVLSLDGKTPQECADEVSAAIPTMLTTRCRKEDLEKLILGNLKDYAKEVGSYSEKGSNETNGLGRQIDKEKINFVRQQRLGKDPEK